MKTARKYINSIFTVMLMIVSVVIGSMLYKTYSVNSMSNEEKKIIRLGRILNFCLTTDPDTLSVFYNFYVNSRSGPGMKVIGRDSSLSFPNTIIYPEAINFLLTNNDSVIVKCREYSLYEKKSIEYWAKIKQIPENKISDSLTSYLNARITLFNKLNVFTISGENDAVEIKVTDNDGWNIYYFQHLQDSLTLDSNFTRRFIKVGNFFLSKD